VALFGSLNTAVGALLSQTAALQTVGHNVANANTPGFSRQRVELETNPANDFQRFQVGNGVRIAHVRRIVDLALENRLRGSTADLGRQSVQTSALERLESIFHALSDTDLASLLDQFFRGVEDVAQHPEDLSARAQLISRGQTLARAFNFLDQQIRDARTNFNDEILLSVDRINLLTAEIARLNQEVSAAENGGFDLDAANDLRDRRELKIKELADLVGITALENSRGQVNVLVNGSYLVFANQFFALTNDDAPDAGILASTVLFASGKGLFNPTSGRIAGLINARDGIAKDIQRDLNVLANAIIYEVNRIQSTGQGLVRLRDVTSQAGVTDTAFPIAIAGTVTQSSTLGTLIDSSLVGFPDLTGRSVLVLDGQNALERRTITAFDAVTGTLTLDAPLRTAVALGDRFQVGELDFPVVNGSFRVVVTNELTGSETSTTITVDLDKSLAPGPTITDETLASIVAQLNAVDPSITASIDLNGRLRITSADDNVRFSFIDDTSGFLAAMGLNSFFTGSDAGDMGVDEALAADPSLLSAALTNRPGDNANAVRLSQLRDQDVVLGLRSFEESVQTLFGTLGALTREAQDRLDNQNLVQQQLENQRQRVSGVNVDEEAANMIVFQRAFQASARLIVVVDQLLETLINSV
jgi:flagellar hook-associated protein 1 FlgK